MDEDDARVDGADLLFEFGLAVRGDLCAQHDQVDLCDIELAGDVAEVVCRQGGVAEVAQASDGVVEDTLALAEHQDASLRVVGCHGSSCFLGWLGQIAAEARYGLAAGREAPGNASFCPSGHLERVDQHDCRHAPVLPVLPGRPIGLPDGVGTFTS